MLKNARLDYATIINNDTAVQKMASPVMTQSGSAPPKGADSGYDRTGSVPRGLTRIDDALMHSYESC